MCVSVVGDDPFLASSPHSDTHTREGRPDQVPHPEQGEYQLPPLAYASSVVIICCGCGLFLCLCELMKQENKID